MRIELLIAHSRLCAIYVDGIFNENKKIFAHRPHTHRFKPALFEKDGIHYIQSDIKISSLLEEEYQRLNFPNRYIAANTSYPSFFSINWELHNSTDVAWYRGSHSCI